MDMSRDARGPADPLRSERRLARTYIFALLLIAALAISTHTLVDVLVAAERTATRVVDVAGRQRMLSQRIGLLALELAHADDVDRRARLRQRLAMAAAEMHRSHVGLLRGDQHLGVPGLQSDGADDIYFGAPHELDLQVRTFIGAARSFSQLPGFMATADSPFLGFLIAAPRERLLRGLDAVVEQYVRDSQDTVRRLRVVLWSLLAALLATIAAEGLFVFRPAFRKLLERTRELYEMARTDPLTGSHNRRSFLSLAEAEHERVRRYGRPCSLLMIDIDHFKAVNDTHGHAVGDEVIRCIARVCVAELRRSDVFGRLGGEEFAAVLPDTAPQNALAVGEKLRAAVEAVAVPLPGGGTLSVTISIGAAGLRPEDHTLHEVLNRADRRLYRAKDEGRNRVDGPRTAPPVSPA